MNALYTPSMKYHERMVLWDRSCDFLYLLHNAFQNDELDELFLAEVVSRATVKLFQLHFADKFFPSIQIRFNASQIGVISQIYPYLVHILFVVIVLFDFH